MGKLLTLLRGCPVFLILLLENLVETGWGHLVVGGLRVLVRDVEWLGDQV
jgi:hypothetical protein